MGTYLNIVCLDVPYPADYGGAIDMMNRIKTLHDAGVKIILHYFSYNNRGRPNELNAYCEAVKVYERKQFFSCFSLSTPYIVASRTCKKLIAELNSNDYPIWLEGLHCTGVLPFIDNKHRKIMVRMHNEESRYYSELGKGENNLLKKLYFFTESALIEKYTKQLPNTCTYACITEKDKQRFEEKYGLQNVSFLPAFSNWNSVECMEGMGTYCLFHGNLSVPENEKAAMWLLTKVFSEIRLPLVIAGKNPSKKLLHAAKLCNHTCLVENPTEAEMNDLVQKAQIITLPCFNKKSTGVKLKLLHSLYEGRHCVANSPMVEGSGLAEACHIADNAAGFSSIISQLFYLPFPEEEIKLRKRILANTYNNKQNTETIMQWLA